MNDFEFALREALKSLERYPEEIEELATQMHNISQAIFDESEKHNIMYSSENIHVIDVV